MAGLQRLPVGVEDFEKIRTEHFYYVDKTKLIEQLLDRWGMVNLFTRPRRFGKTLNMSMLCSFFEIGANPKLFDGLYISKNRELCETYMGKFPVIFISLKGVNAENFEEAKKVLTRVMNEEIRRVFARVDTAILSDIDRKLFEQLSETDPDQVALAYRLRELSEFLSRYYKEKVIILIDEYDVPLAKANERGYYDQMVLLIRNFFENALKTNNSLKFAVLTGCLRVAKESIFTGLNNFKMYPITKVAFDEYFGFTDSEVRQMLSYYGIEEKYDTVREWYDGYRFGKVDVYCPWDVINYCSDHLDDPEIPPQNYWANTSGNEVIRHFLDSMGQEQKLTRAELERLVNGEIVQKEINQELTYKELYSSMDHIWSTLFMTGYLTSRGEPDGNRYNLAVPNREIRNIITDHILKLFRENVAKDGSMVKKFCNALLDGDTETVECLFTEYMAKTVSVRDTFVRKPIKENFYHGLLLGILSYKEGWIVTSNREAGNGFSDIMIQVDDADTGIIVEVKYAESGTEEQECRRALKQIKKQEYAEELRQNGFHKILVYGIACNKKKCRVMMEAVSDCR